MPLPPKPNIAAEIAKKNAKDYPLPAFYYAVSIEDPKGSPSNELSKISFTEVSGLTEERQTVDYRDGMSTSTIPRKIVGMAKFSNIVLKRGMFLANTEMHKWLEQNTKGELDRRTVTIKLLDYEGQPLITWSVDRAFPIKIDGPTLKADGNEVAVESVELAHEGFKIIYKEKK